VQKTGILITNLGTPRAPTASEIRIYLAEFLSDKHVVDFPAWLWQPILHGIILRTRPKRVARLYKKIWTNEGSPLLSFSRNIAASIKLVMDKQAHISTEVALGMRYGDPSLGVALRDLRESETNRLVVLPLYPQYSFTTTRSTVEAVRHETEKLAWTPDITTIADYHDHPSYISALANSIREHWRHTNKGEQLLFSFHGTPERVRRRGDPYYEQCLTTARLVANALELRENEWCTTFQSKFGPGKWLTPATDMTLRKMANEGIKRVDIVCPGFSADCLETLEEIADQNRAVFQSEGGEQFYYIPALNDRPDHIQALVDILTERLH